MKDSEEIYSQNVDTLNAGTSLKKTENLIRCLEKENFNLKLKIYLMEQQFGISSNLPDPKTENERNIIEIIEQNHMMRVELGEKQALLETALDAIEFLENDNESSKSEALLYSSITRKNSNNMKMAKKISKLKKDNYKKFKLIEKLSTQLCNRSKSLEESSDIEIVQNKIIKLQQKLDHLLTEKEHFGKIIDEQNYLMKALNVRNITFGVIIISVLFKRLLQ